jgi:hypothetical protein
MLFLLEEAYQADQHLFFRSDRVEGEAEIKNR